MSDILIDQSRRCAYLHGQAMQLSPQEYRVLYCLGCNVEEVVAKQDLLAAMWSTAEQARANLVGFTVAAVDLVICRLRKKLGDQAQHPIYLETRRGFGYILHHAQVVSSAARVNAQAFVDRSEQAAPAETSVALVETEQPWATLTRREWTIFLLLGDEQTIRLTDKALAQQLQMAEGTLKKHLQHIYRKLDVENRSGAALLAMRVKAHLLKT